MIGKPMFESSRNAPAAILPLPADAIEQIKSSVTITSLASVVFGLLQNALDAGATRLEITIDSRRGGCTIEDNGCGILPSEFRESGGLGLMYHTSKQNNVPYASLHGGKGTFLASLAALSLVTITSRHHRHYSHNTLVLHRTKPIVRLTPAPADHEIHGFMHGTRVVVRDLFGNLPVRVKQRVMTANDSSEVEKNWQTLKKGIVGLLLPWNGPIIVKVRDAEDRSRSFSIARNNVSSASTVSQRSLDNLEQRATGFDLRSSVSILVQAGYVSPDKTDTWVPFFASTPSITVRGMISLEPAPSKSCQFISIGITPTSDETGHHDLYDSVNHIFSYSCFGQIDNDSEPGIAELERRRNDRRFKTDGPTERQRKGGMKGVDRWPMFYLRIELEQGDATTTSGSEVNLKNVVDVLQALATRWLEENHFRPRKRTSKKRLAPNDLNSPPNVATSRARSCGPMEVRTASPNTLVNEVTSRSKKRALDKAQLDANPSLPQMPFTEWSRIKSGNAAFYDNVWKCNSPPRASSLPASAVTGSSAIKVQPLSAGELGSGSSTPIPGRRAAPPVSPQVTGGIGSDVLENTLVDSGYIEWTNPATKQKCRIDARTGTILHGAQNSSSHGDLPLRRPAAMYTELSRASRPLYLQRRRSATTEKDPSPWLKGFLKDWSNPIFAQQTEQPIPVANFEGPGQKLGSIKHSCKDHDLDNTLLQISHGSSSQISKDSLKKADVISQVDQKFILLKMSTLEHKVDDIRELLVLVDQHAASERCILEELFAELCIPNTDPQSVKSNLGFKSQIRTIKLEKPLQFQLSKNEGRMFLANASHFSSWGIVYNINKNGSENSRLDVLTLPPGIAERCKTESKTLIELLRSEIYNLAETPITTNMSQRLDPAATVNTEADEPHAWLRKMRTCPNGIIKLLNSRACRSAIMFNDKLSTMECRELVRTLSRCAFPFTCAHGRVSMVPMIYLGGHQDVDDGEGGRSGVFEGAVEREEGFVKSFKRWRADKGMRVMETAGEN